jgi:prepilin-type N-terminal cleavage/methylation domain-containing protein
MLIGRDRAADMNRQVVKRRDGVDDSATPVGDDGFSLVEVIIAIVLMGSVILALINATFTSVKASSSARESAEIQTVLQNAADRVNRADPGCDYLLAVQAAAVSKGWQASQATATYQYYMPGVDALASHPGTWTPATPGPASADACPISVTAGVPVRTARLIQLVTISITDTNGQQRTIQVVKSDI